MTLLLAHGRPDGLIACTDADSRPAPDWLERQIAHVAAGAQAIAGMIELDADEAEQLPPGVLGAACSSTPPTGCGVCVPSSPGAAHHHAAGASLAVTAGDLSRGGRDRAIAGARGRGLRRAPGPASGSRSLRPSDVRVVTSARADGRVSRGLSVDLALSSWFARRRYRAGDFSVDELCARKGLNDGHA